MGMLRLIVTSYLATYCGVVVYWLVGEYTYPGTSYPPPWLPALFVATVLGPFVVLVRIAIRVTVQHYRNKPGVD